MGAVPVVVVLGDSVATSLGLDEQRGHWPSVMRAARPDVRVVSFARISGQIDDSVARLDAIIAAQPKVVIIAHGGRDCLIQTPLALRLIKTDPDGAFVATPLGIVRAVRRAVYRRVLGELENRRRGLITPLMRLTPNVSSERFAELFDELVSHLLSRCDASIVVLVPHGHAMGFHPWSLSAVDVAHSIMHASSQRDPRVTVVDLGDTFARDPMAYQFDGVHFSPEGHRRVAAALVPALLPALPNESSPEHA